MNLFSSWGKKNWSKNQIWYPKEIFSPSSLSEIQDIIKKAKKEKTKIRAVGTCHSFNELPVSSEYQILTDKLNKVLDIDSVKQTVRVEGGIKIYVLLEILAKSGLTLPNQGYIRDQSIAGAIATATHGSGNTGTLSSFVIGVELVDSSGTLHLLNPQTDLESFEAAVVSLGSLGIVYAVTLQCVPVFKLELNKIPIELDGVLEDLSDIRKEYPFFQFIRDLYNDQAIGYYLKPTDKPVNINFWDKLRFMAIKGHALLNMNVWRPPSFAIPLGIDIYMKLVVTRNKVDYNYRILSPEDEGCYMEQELAIPVKFLPQALTLLKQIIDRYSEKGMRILAVNIVRFAEQDKFGFLSPTRDGAKAYVSLICFRKKGVLNLFREVETAFYQFHCKPHWGKIHFLTKDKIKLLYGANYDRFVAVRQKLDPDRMFSNPFIEDLFD